MPGAKYGFQVVAGFADSGRAAVTAVVAEAMAAAVEGTGRLVLILGEPGIGKTTAARQAAASARRAGFAVRWSACWSGGGTVAHAPWLTVLPGLGPAGREALAALLGTGPGADDVMAAAAARAAAYAAAVGALEQAAAQQPVMIVLDDLHWADEGSLQLLESVAAHLPGIPVVIVGTYRPTDVGSGGGLSRLGGGTDRIELRGVDEARVVELLTTHIGAGRAAGLAAEVVRLTAGNPFLIVQLGRLLADDPGALTKGILPVGARDLLEQRLGVLSADARGVLTGAAVLGGPFGITELSVVSGREPPAVDEVLAKAAALRIVERAAGTGLWAFVHDLFRQAALQAGEPAVVARMHGRAAEVRQEADAEPAAIAAHLLQAGPDRAITAGWWLVQAGDRALAALAWEEAAGHYELALSAIAGHVQGEVRADALAGLGRARMLRGDPSGAAEAFDELAAIGRRSGSATQVATAALGWSTDLAGFEIRLFDQRQIDLLEEAARALAAADPPVPALQATVVGRLSVALSLVAPDERRRTLAEQAVTLARQAGDPIILARGLAAHCDAIAGPDHSEDREAEAGEIIAIALEAGDGVLELLGRRLRYVARLEQGNVAGVAEDIAAFARRADAIGNPLYRWYVPLWRGQEAIVAGDAAAATAGIEEIRALGRASGSINAPMLAFILELALHNLAGDYQAALDALSGFALDSPNIAQFVSSLGALASTHHRAGHQGEARAFLDRAGAVGLHSVPFDAEWLPNAICIVLAAAELGHPILEEAVSLLEPWAHRVAFEGIGAGLYGSAARFMAVGCAALGRHDDAVRYAEAALTVNRRLGGVLIADALRTLATVVGGRDGEGDTDRSMSLHAEADRAYAAVGVHHLVRPAASIALEPPAEPASQSSPEPVNEFRRSGEVWQISYAGTSTVLRHSKGLADLAVLLSRPGTEVHVAELEGVPRYLTESSGGEALDRRAISAYKDRLAEVAEEIDDADANHDLARAERARVEYDALVEQLSSSVGLGGRSRAAGPEPVERLRKAVSARVRDAIRHIEAAHPSLGRHLANTVRTGIYCMYRPEGPTVWRCQARSGAERS